MLIEADAKILYGKDRIKFIKDLFVERTIKHSNLVNAYGALFGKSYETHDFDKMIQLLDGYCYYVIPREYRNQIEEDSLDRATLKHIKGCPHHPEFWSHTSMEGWTRTCVTPNGIIDATQMPENAIEEMVCDWKATSDEKKDNIDTWIKHVVPKRWKFTDTQMQIITKTAELLKQKRCYLPTFNIGDIVTYKYKEALQQFEIVSRTMPGSYFEYCLKDINSNEFFVTYEHNLRLFKRYVPNLKGE